MRGFRIEVITSSDKSFDEAIETEMGRASQRGFTVASVDVLKQRLVLGDGGQRAYEVTMCFTVTDGPNDPWMW